MSIFKNSSILITGGTGSFGIALLKKLINTYPEIRRIIIYSRDELKQWNLQQEYPKSKFPQLRYFLGDIRDKDRLKRAFEGVDYVVHAAALKQVPAAEYNPMEFVKTNVLGSQNVIEASLDSSVRRVVALSTDKAAAPVNLYGATKLCADKLFVAANNMKGKRDLSISVVRYGNVMGSRGSVIPFFLKQAKKGCIPITDLSMTRFSISLEEGVDLVIWSILNSLGGEIFVPKIPSYKISDLAEAIGPNCTKEIIGIRPGEKIHEEMITYADSFSTVDCGDYFSILPFGENNTEDYLKFNPKFQKVEYGFSYNSSTNNDFLSVEKLRKLIKKYVDPNFIPL